MNMRVLRAGLYVVLALILIYVLSLLPQFMKPADVQTAVEVPFLKEWEASAHADEEAEAFSHWNEDEPKEIPVECAKCHSTFGYRDFIGADGSPAGQVDTPAPVGTTVECVACHSQTTFDLDRVVMPSGAEITGLGGEARCMQCHQGRASKFSIDKIIVEANLPDLDTVNPDFEFINIHYYAAVATKYGTLAKAGYEYDGKSYDAHFAHITHFDPCIACHAPHTQHIKIDECQTCHKEVTSQENLKDIRMYGSLVDYDGDGNIEEGIYYEIRGLQNLLYQAIQAYAREKSNTPIVYDLYTHPYFFVDTNNNGKTDEDEVKYPNKYKAWTSRLLKAAYNYQISIKDPGTFAHGGKYIIQLLYDSIEDLNMVISTPIDLTLARRIDDGHFAGSEEAFRHWDEDGEVPGSCSKCHSATGLPFFLKEGCNASQPLANGFQCSTCHDDLTTYSRYEVKAVQFPSGAVIDSEDLDTNLCMTCHQGRQSTVDVQRATKGLDDDAVSDKLSFKNIHYFAAGATKYGTEAKGGYEYDGKKYVGIFKHVPNYTECTSCHSTHQLEVKVEECTKCHLQGKDGGSLEAIRMIAPDYDGDGNMQEGVAEELDALRQVLYAAILEYAKNVVKTPIVHDSRPPYFFTDTNGNGQLDPDEVNEDNRYNSWTPRLLRAAYNYQYVTKDPGGFAHNSKYIAQLLYDSLENLAALKEGMLRP